MLFNAMNQTAKTANGATTLHTSSDPVVDLFFMIGSSRGKDIREDFRIAYAIDKNLATRVLLWARDVRGGAGERQTFITLMQELIQIDREQAIKVLHKIPEMGRWKDLVSLFDTRLNDEAMSLIAIALANENGLCAKWMPRKGPMAAKLRRFLELDARSYRKLLVSMTDVVETKMCAKNWDQIDFSKLPSLASARYQKAFGRNAHDRYSNYIESLKKGETTINAGAVYPYDIVKSVNYGNSDVADAQWKSLPDYCDGSNERVIPVVDVSGSMMTSAGGSQTITCLDVAISLGIYISERMTGAFKDQFITFSESPKMYRLTGSLTQRINQLRRADWGYNTNLQKVFTTILEQATTHKIPEDQMPTKIIILSDMEFDSACTNRQDYFSERKDHTNYQAIEREYEKHGYKRPDIIFWNLNARSSNVPVTAGTHGTALVSGFSPSIMRSILSAKVVTPYDIMMETIGNSRYDF